MLSIVGAGFGRTGTTSLRSALESLGFAKCYHMSEVFLHPEHIDIWKDAGDGKPVDWDALLEGYRAAIDYPAAHFWKELMTHYPESKVILTVRDTEAWFTSISQTILTMTDIDLSNAPEYAQRQRAMARMLVVDQYFEGNISDPAHMKATFEASNEKIRQTVPADRLLVYEVAQGWPPLCEFLDCPVPDEEFPHLNTTKDFQKFAAGYRSSGSTTDLP
jgi:hypothetical protein